MKRHDTDHEQNSNVFNEVNLESYRIVSEIGDIYHFHKDNISLEDFTEVILEILFIRFISLRKTIGINDQKLGIINLAKADWDYIIQKANIENVHDVLIDAKSEIEASFQFDLTFSRIYQDQIDKLSLIQILDLLSIYHVDNEKLKTEIVTHVFDYMLRKVYKPNGIEVTPVSIIHLINKICKIKNGDRIYDPNSNFGEMLTQLMIEQKMKNGSQESITLLCQERSNKNRNIGIMYSTIHDVKINFGNYAVDAITDDLHKNKFMNLTISNLLFSHQHCDINKKDSRWKFGVPRTNGSDSAYISHCFSKLAKDGKAVLVLGCGFLNSKFKSDSKIRKNLIEANCVECVISLPRHLFKTTSISVCILILSNNRKKDKRILLIDASGLGRLNVGNQVTLMNEDIEDIARIYNDWSDEKEIFESLCKFKDIDIDYLRNSEFILYPLKC